MIERRSLQKVTPAGRELHKVKHVVEPTTSATSSGIKAARAASGTKKRSAIGYGKPPRHTQFRPGHSGNPAGRRKGARNFATDVKHALTASMNVTDEDASRTISAQEAALSVLLQEALKGRPQALKNVMHLADRFNNEPAEADQILSPDDEAILAAYDADIIASYKAEIFAALKAIIESIAAASGTSRNANAW